MSLNSLLGAEEGLSQRSPYEQEAPMVTPPGSANAGPRGSKQLRGTPFSMASEAKSGKGLGREPCLDCLTPGGLITTS